MIAVTGAAGFIGSVLVGALNGRGEDDILIVDTLGSDGKFRNLCGKRYRDIMDPATFATRLEAGDVDPDGILHIGAITDTGERDADLMLRQNSQYTRRIAVAAMERGIRFVYASSGSVYGDGSLGFSDEDALTPKFRPLNPYAFSKWLFDCEAIRNGWTEKIAGLRFYNVFGPNEYHKGRMASVIWHSYRQIQETGKLQLFQSHRPDYADGEQRRDFIYVMDVADAVLWFLENPAVGGIYNLGTGKARTFNALAGAIFGALGKEPVIDYVPTPESFRGSYQYFTEANLVALRASGYRRPFTSLEDATADYVGRFLTQDNPYF